jgi:hypothetical protein
MANLKLDLSAAQRADNLLFGLIDRITMGVERSKDRRLARESMALRKQGQEFYQQQTLVRSALTSLESTIDQTRNTSGSVELALDLLKEESELYVKNNPDVYNQFQKTISFYEEALPGIRETETIVAEGQALAKKISDMSDDDLTDENKLKELHEATEEYRVNSANEFYSASADRRKEAAILLARSDRVQSINSKLRQLDAGPEPGYQRADELGEIDISNEFFEPVHVFLDAMNKSYIAGDLEQSEKYLVSANQTLATLLAKKSAAILESDATPLWDAGIYGTYTGPEVSEIFANDKSASMLAKIEDTHFPGNIGNRVRDALIKRSPIDIENKAVSPDLIFDIMQQYRQDYRFIFDRPDWRRMNGDAAINTWVTGLLRNEDGLLRNSTLVKDDIAHELKMGKSSYKGSPKKGLVVDVLYEDIVRYDKMLELLRRNTAFDIDFLDLTGSKRRKTTKGIQGRIQTKNTPQD